MKFLPVLAFLISGCARTPEPAELVFRNVLVYTVDPDQPTAAALGIRGGKIVYVGSDGGATEWIGPGTEVIDGQGGMLLPGFVDSHVHPISGVELLECDLSEDSTHAQVIVSIRRCADARPDAPWVRGSGWQLPLFDRASPTAALLDLAVADRPAYLTAADGHSAWVNSRAIALAGLSVATPDPPHGRIERDWSGSPSGTLRESAMELVSKLLPSYTTEEYITGYRAAFKMANRFGITSMIEANADSAMLQAYHQMDSAGQLTVRITASQQLNHEQGPAQLARLIRLRDRYQSRMLQLSSAKFFADGVIEAGTAALLQPYLNRPGNSGTLNLDPAGMDSLVAALDRAGFQVHVHAIGDRAIRVSLDALERARTANGVRDSRHILAHIQLIDPQDVPRFKQLGVIADFQPLWAYDDEYIVDLTIPVLGPERSRWLYPIASVLKTGATVTGGSDWSVSSMNPLEAIQVAVTRRGPDEDPGEGWIPAERADLASMIAAYTINGAYARFADSTTGSLEVGKLADLVLLDRNLIETPTHEIAKAEVQMTMLNGRIVYRK